MRKYLLFIAILTLMTLSATGITTNPSFTEGAYLRYTESPSTQNMFGLWNGTAIISNVSASGLGTIGQWMTVESSPSRDQYVTILSADNLIAAAVHNGTSFTQAINLSTTIGTTNDNFRGFDMDYMPDGTGMVVFNNNTANESYILFNGTRFTTSAMVGADNCTGIPVWIDTAAGKNGTMFIVSMDTNGDVCSNAWNGSAWGAPRTLETLASVFARNTIEIAVEDITGDAMVVWETGTVGVIGYCKYDMNNGTFANGWCNNHRTMNLPSLGDAVYFDSDNLPETNRLLFGFFQDTLGDVSVVEWNGINFSNNNVPTSIDATAEAGGLAIIGVAYFGTSGMAAFVDNGLDVPSYSICNGTLNCEKGNWTVGASTGFTAANCGTAGDLDYVGLRANPLNDRIMLYAAQQTVHAKCIQEWNGVSWNQEITNTGTGAALLDSIDSFFEWDKFIDLSAPAIMLISPPNNTINTTSPVLRFSVDDESPISQCNVTINGMVNATFPDLNRNQTAMVNQTYAPGNYSWNVTCVDIAERAATSGTQRFTIVTSVNPAWSFPVAFPTSPTVYRPDVIHSFNVTWTDPDENLDTVVITHDFFGAPAEFATTASGNRYSYLTSSLAAGNYTWFQKANDTVGNENQTDTFDYIVLKSPPALQLLLNGEDSDAEVDPGEQVDIFGRIINGTGTLELFINGTLVDTGTSNVSANVTFFANFTYPVLLRLNESQNYTEGSVTHDIIVPPFDTQGIFPALRCPNDTLSNTFIFMFIGIFLVLILFVNMVTFRIPALNIVIGLGIMAYSFTLMGCSYVMGFFIFIIGMLIIASSLLMR